VKELLARTMEVAVRLKLIAAEIPSEIKIMRRIQARSATLIN
jgi:hypothetical protein